MDLFPNPAKGMCSTNCHPSSGSTMGLFGAPILQSVFVPASNRVPMR